MALPRIKVGNLRVIELVNASTEFAAFIVRETRKWSEVIRVAGVKGE